ncbi:hypothetical protein NQ317_005967 [Molorchus minor]|uniref:GH18 domain-containing protein n=1 Tax=Molorchus minor TaxID=1323400 RepID=A0ABQ9IVX2_9CUCU|nr:hypothetical protein NQ317_005967 [Molorchus minor]
MDVLEELEFDDVIQEFVKLKLRKKYFDLQKVVCYYQGSNGVKLAPPEELDASLCTHINYAFIQIDKNGNLTEQNPKIDIGLSMFTRVTSLKKLNPDLKVLLSVGDTAATWRLILRRDRIFILFKHILFDGLDIDWEKPEPEDAESFLALLEELKKEFENFGWTLSAAVYPNPSNGYNTTEIVKYLDFLNLMTYNYFGGWSIHTGQTSPLFKSSLDSPYEKTYLNVAASINFWLAAGVPKDKLVVGLAFYGRSFTLADADDHGLHAPVTGAGITPSATYRQISLATATGRQFGMMNRKTLTNI